MIKRNSESGSVFVLAIWSVMMLAIFAVGLAGMARQRALVYQRLEKREELKWVAEAAVKKIIYDLRKAVEDPSFIHEKKWYDTSLGTTEMTVGRGLVRYSLLDESGKINLNTASFETLATLFQNVAHMSEEPARHLAAAVMDFRDSDDHVSTYFESTGSERAAYNFANLSYQPLNRDFQYLSELRFVKGMTAEIFNKMKDVVTAHGESTLNLNMASAAAMHAMGIEPETADKIVAIRQGLDRRDGTDDDLVIESLQTLSEELRSRYGLSEQEDVSLQNGINHGLFATRPEMFRIAVDARIAGTKDHKRVVCLYGISKGLMYWYEN